MAIALSLAFTPTPLGATEQLVIYASPQVSAGVNFMPRKRYKFIQAEAAASASPADMLTNYTAIYGALISGRKIFIIAKVIDNATGQASTELGTNVIVT
jgi:RecG-like helicase